MAAFSLPPEAEAAGYRVIGYDTIGSTNAEAMAAGAAGNSGNVWYAALQQTAGRGRRGRNWESTHGNLAASLLIVLDDTRAELATLGFVAGVALNAALTRILPAASIRTGIDGADGTSGAGEARIALKWPNDVLLDGAKLAGILLEAQRRRDGATAVVIGFGVNVVAAPEGLPYPATSLHGLGAPIDAQSVFEALAASWHQHYEIWRGPGGTAEILSHWRQSAAGIGAPVAVKTNTGVVRGVFETIDDAGQLIVRDDEGHRVAIAAGDVHFGTVATQRSV